jgi:large subunit ribosomal protein L15
MRLHELHPAPGSRRARKRIGRGISAGQGKTSGRGQKGQGARTEGLPKGFEGGQMPLSQRLPKLRGFHNRFKKDYAVVNVSKLRRFEPGSVVDSDALRAAGLVGASRDGIKVLGAGRLRHAVTLRVHRVSAGARAAVEKAGGSVELLEAAAAEPVGDAVAEVSSSPVEDAQNSSSFEDVADSGEPSDAEGES